MTEHRWSKFWWQDWQRDPALRSCSVAARGLWMDMLAIAFDGAPRGYVTIGSKSATPKQLATIAGITEKHAVNLIAELEDAGVFSRTADGCIYNRRMVRDAEASEAGREAIAKRWGKRDKPNTPPNRVRHSPPESLEAEADTEADILPPVCPPSVAPRAASPTHAKTGIRLPADWHPSVAMEGFAAGLGLNTDAVAAQFRDYWTAQPGQKGRKTDWDATWRNWCRREAERPKPKLHTVPAGEQDRRILAAVGLGFEDKPPLIQPQLRIAQ